MNEVAGDLVLTVALCMTTLGGWVFGALLKACGVPAVAGLLWGALGITVVAILFLVRYPELPVVILDSSVFLAILGLIARTFWDVLLSMHPVPFETHSLDVQSRRHIKLRRDPPEL